MGLSRLYIDTPLAVGQMITLDEEATRHLIKVLRLPVGAVFSAFNGQEGDFEAELIKVGKKPEAIIRAHHPRLTESPITINLYQGISRSQRMDYVIQKATELGVNYIYPICTTRTVVRLDDEKAVKRQAHWQKIAIHASEQSGRVICPAVQPVQSFKEALSTASGTRLLLDTVGAQRFKSIAALENQTVSILIGPEGGLSDEEITAAKASGFCAIQLGPRIFRTETAPIVILSLLQQTFGDFDIA